jgi:uncharacterized protein
MQYNVAQLLKGPIGDSSFHNIEEIFTEEERITDRVGGPVQMVRTHQGVLVNAELDIQTTLTCGRCLGEFSWPSTLYIEEEFFPILDLHTGWHMPPPSDDEDNQRIDVDNVLDLTEIMRQSVIADMPMKPLCQANCLGLCWVCGNNLNLGECNCSDAEVDPRWGALADLLKSQKR